MNETTRDIKIMRGRGRGDTSLEFERPSEVVLRLSDRQLGALAACLGDVLASGEPEIDRGTSCVNVTRFHNHISLCVGHTEISILVAEAEAMLVGLAEGMSEWLDAENETQKATEPCGVDDQDVDAQLELNGNGDAIVSKALRHDSMERAIEIYYKELDDGHGLERHQVARPEEELSELRVREDNEVEWRLCARLNRPHCSGHFDFWQLATVTLDGVVDLNLEAFGLEEEDTYVSQRRHESEQAEGDSTSDGSE